MSSDQLLVIVKIEDIFMILSGLNKYTMTVGYDCRGVGESTNTFSFE